MYGTPTQTDDLRVFFVVALRAFSVCVDPLLLCFLGVVGSVFTHPHTPPIVERERQRGGWHDKEVAQPGPPVI